MERITKKSLREAFGPRRVGTLRAIPDCVDLDPAFLVHVTKEQREIKARQDALDRDLTAHIVQACPFQIGQLVRFTRLRYRRTLKIQEITGGYDEVHNNWQWVLIGKLILHNDKMGKRTYKLTQHELSACWGK